MVCLQNSSQHQQPSAVIWVGASEYSAIQTKGEMGEKNAVPVCYTVHENKPSNLHDYIIRLSVLDMIHSQ